MSSSTGPPVAGPHRIGKRLLPPMDDRFSASRYLQGHLQNRRQGSRGNGGRRRPPPRRLSNASFRERLASSLEETQLPGPGDGLVTGRGRQLGIQRVRLRLDGVRRQGHLRSDLRERQVRAEQWQQAQLGGGQGRCSRRAWTVLFRQLGPEPLGLADEDAEAGRRLSSSSISRMRVPGPGQVGQGEVDAGQFDPGPNGDVGERVG